MSPAIKAALPRISFNSRIPTAVRQCPNEYNGAGILSLYDYQGTSRTSMVLEHVYKKSTTGKLLIQCIEDLVLETGLYGLLWDMPFNEISKYVSKHSIIFHLLQYNHEKKICLHLKHSTLQPQRHQDIPIMSLACTYFTKVSDLKAIQRVRMSLGLIHLSDITSADGYRLDPYFFKKKQKKVVRNFYQWPNKHHICYPDYIVWRKLLRLIYPTNQMSLANPLGEWNPMTKNVWLHTWDFFTSYDKQFIYKNIGKGTWHRFLRKPNCRRSYFTTPLIMNEDPDSNLYRASVTHHHDTIQLSSYSNEHSNPISTYPTNHWDSIYFNDLLCNWFTSSFSSSASTSSLLHHLTNGTALGVSDGSFYPSHKVGACAWIISTPDGNEWVKGGGIIPGPSHVQSAYRSELGGLLGLLLFLQAIVLPPSPRSTITIACDGKSALKQVNIKKVSLKSKMLHIDLISAIHDIVDQSYFNFNTVHVKGHQDTAGHTLTNLETLNCQMDQEAKEIALSHITSHQQLNHPPPPTSLGFGSITISDSIISSNIQSNLYKNITHNAFISWFINKSTNSSNIKNTHWECIKLARKLSTFETNIFITKWISGFIATGRYMTKIKLRHSSNCPLCNTPNEDQTHILTCSNSNLDSLRCDLLSNIKTWMESAKTSPYITNFIYNGIHTWFQNPLQPNHLHIDPCTSEHIQRGILSQQSIGWFNTLCGFFNNDFINIQSSHYTSINSKQSATIWAAKLISKLWNLLQSIWIHRNIKLHRTNSIHLLSGLPHLKQSIIQEHQLGPLGLPTIYSSYFYQPLQKLLSRSAFYLKSWFLTIRSARECHQPDLCDDNFSNDSPLRAWIGLKPIS